MGCSDADRQEFERATERLARTQSPFTGRQLAAGSRGYSQPDAREIALPSSLGPTGVLAAGFDPGGRVLGQGVGDRAGHERVDALV
jgi:hypothetical protein